MNQLFGAKIQYCQAWLQVEQFLKQKSDHFAFELSVMVDSPFSVAGIYELSACLKYKIFINTYLSQPFPTLSKIHLLLAREQLVQARP
jgi:hypothetical protein